VAWVLIAKTKYICAATTLYTRLMLLLSCVASAMKLKTIIFGTCCEDVEVVLLYSGTA
jgi:hypothetical protein